MSSSLADMAGQSYENDFLIQTADGVKLRVFIAGSHGRGKPCLLLLHGANYSAAVFRYLLPYFTQHYYVVAFDARGHGASDSHGDVSASALTADVLAIVQHIRTTTQVDSFILLGHSMGGAIALHAAHNWPRPPFTPLAGIIVIDFAEGTAVESIDYTLDVVQRMPHAFGCEESAIEWALSSGTLRCARSVAAAIIPSTLATLSEAEALTWDSRRAVFPPNSLPKLRWIASDFLLRSPPHWRAWYAGCSSFFLGAPCPKLCILAGGADRLDGELLLGQMQGKFTLRIVAGGHVLMADAPDKVAAEVHSFCSRAGLLTVSESELLEARLRKARGH